MKALKKKIIEEAKELAKTESKKDIINEFSDILEIMECIAYENQVSLKDIQKKKQEKRREKGGFEKKIFLKYIEK